MPRFNVIVRQTIEVEVPVEAESADAAWEQVDPFTYEGEFEVLEAEVVAVSQADDDN